MEKIKCICIMKDLFKAISELENSLSGLYGLSLNEAIVLCAIGEESVAAGTIASRTGFKASHLSKILRSAENKGYIARSSGDQDRRQMYFSNTVAALERLDEIKCGELPVPEMLKSLFK